LSIFVPVLFNHHWQKKNSYTQNFSIVNQSLQRQMLLSVSKSMRKIGLTEIQKQTTVQHLREGIGQTKNQTYEYITFIKKAMFTQLKFLIFGSVLSSVYEFFLASDSTYV
jgi:hypothetical protein